MSGRGAGALVGTVIAVFVSFSACFFVIVVTDDVETRTVLLVVVEGKYTDVVCGVICWDGCGKGECNAGGGGGVLPLIVSAASNIKWASVALNEMRRFINFQYTLLYPEDNIAGGCLYWYSGL